MLDYAKVITMININHLGTFTSGFKKAFGLVGIFVCAHLMEELFNDNIMYTPL